MRPVPQRLLALCLALLVPGVALGEEGGGRRHYLHPSVTVRSVANDNVFFEKQGAEGDVGFWIQPRLELGYRTSVWEVGADLGVDFRRYTRHAELNQTFFRVKAFAEAGILPGLSVRVDNDYVPQPVVLGLPEDDTGNLLQTNRTRAEIRYWRAFDDRREITIGVLGQRFITDSFGETEFSPDQFVSSSLAPPTFTTANLTPAVAPKTNGNFWRVAPTSSSSTPCGAGAPSICRVACVIANSTSS